MASNLPDFDFEQAAALLMKNCYQIIDANGGLSAGQGSQIYNNTLDVLTLMAPHLGDDTNANIATDLIGG